jgi:uncharacterized protein (TIGR02266 family)
MQDQSFDRRQTKRHKAHLRILFQRSGAAHFVDAETEDISIEGVYIWTHRRPLEVGTNVSMLLRLSNVEKELMLEGVVTRVDQDGPQGMGIRFRDLDTDSRKILSAALQ